jgi:Ser/Thr protein kinase RdoA (MazF antagonist)
MESSETVTSTVCAAYGLDAGSGTSFTPVARGMMGQIWRLSLSSASFAVKEFFWGADEEAVRQETNFTRHLLDAGIRLPASIPDTDGNYLFKLPDRLGGACIRLYQWVDGVPVNGTQPGLAAEAGQLLGHLHANTLPSRGEVGDWYETAPSAESWADLAEAGLKEQQPWAKPLETRLGLLESLGRLVSPAPRDSLVMCHRDFAVGNMFKDSDGNLILLDWDDAGPASPDRELAQILLSWHVSDGKIDPVAVRDTLRAYLAAEGTGRITDERSFGMAIAGRVNFPYVQAKAAIDPNLGAPQRSFASDATMNALRDLITPDLIHRFVETSVTAQQEISRNA